MALTAAQVVVGAAETALMPAESGPSGAWLVLKNAHATDAVALGPTGVTAGAGFQLAAGATVTVELSHGEQLFGIRTGASDATVHVLRSGV